MDKEYYTAQLTAMKALGYNYIRFHTHSMPDVFHEVQGLGHHLNPI